MEKKYIGILIGVLIIAIIAISSHVPKQTVVSASCNQISDCPIPTKNSCPNFLVGCIANQCAYDKSIPNGVVCGNELVTILMQQNQVEQRTEIPSEGENLFLFSQNYLKTSFSIGDQIFTASPPIFKTGGVCQIPIEDDFLHAPQPSSECWETDATYGGKQFRLKDTQIILIDPLISMQYFAGGTLTRGSFRREGDWSNTFAFTIDTSNAMRLDVEDGSYVLKDSQKKIKINLLNNLPRGEVIIKMEQTARQINLNLPEQKITKILNKGNNELELELNTNNYGINQVAIQMFYIIYADNTVYIPSSKFIINYNVVDKIPIVNNPIIIGENPPSTPNQPANPSQPEKTTQIFLWVALAFVGLLLLKKLFK